MRLIVARLFAFAGVACSLLAPLTFAQSATEAPAGVISEKQAADRAAIEAAAQAWAKAFNARDANALLALATEDLVLLDPNLPPLSGADARESLRKSLGRAPGPITSASKEIVVAGDIAWRFAAISHGSSAGALPRHSQALEIWKRVGTQWKLHRQMSSNLLTPPQWVPGPPPPDPVLDRPAN